MENVKVPENKNAPFIKRTINGQEFTDRKSTRLNSSH